jgi:hypothetical protein
VALKALHAQGNLAFASRPQPLTFSYACRTLANRGAWHPQWVTARGTVANGETMQATSLQGIYAPTPWVQAGPSYAAAPGAAYYQPAHQYANYQPAVSYANSAAAPNSGRIVRLPPQSQQSNNGMRY